MSSLADLLSLSVFKLLAGRRRRFGGQAREARSDPCCEVRGLVADNPRRDRAHICRVNLLSVESSRAREAASRRAGGGLFAMVLFVPAAGGRGRGGHTTRGKPRPPPGPQPPDRGPT